jgi:hypothetical protein
MKGKLTLVSLGVCVCVVLKGRAERLVLELLFLPLAAALQGQGTG